MTRHRERSISEEEGERSPSPKRTKQKHKERNYDEGKDSRENSDKFRKEVRKSHKRSKEKDNYEKNIRHDSKEKDDENKDSESRYERAQRRSEERDSYQRKSQNSEDNYDRRQQRNYSPNERQKHSPERNRKETKKRSRNYESSDDETPRKEDDKRNKEERFHQLKQSEREDDVHSRRNRDREDHVQSRRNRDREEDNLHSRRNRDREDDMYSRRNRDNYSERNRERSPINRRREYENRRNNREEVVEEKEPSPEAPASKTKISTVNLRTGGAYIPPAKLKMLRDQIQDKSSEQYQRLAWEALKKSLTGLTNKVNSSNIKEVVFEIFKENVIRGRGVLTRAIIQAQALSPTFTHVYAALVAIINSKFPNVSELLLKRLLIQFKRGFRRNDKQLCISSTRFIAHLLNQQVAHEVVVLEILTLLLENPTDDSVEIAIAMFKECGKKLSQLCKKGSFAIFERLKHILNEATLDKRVQYMIEVMFAVRKDNFKDFVDIPEGLDLINEEDKFTHLITLEEAKDSEDLLNVFQFDPEYLTHEDWYKGIQKDILESDDESGESGSSGDESSSGEEDGEENKEGETTVITDMTETNLVALRRNIYLTIQSSLDFEECAHKLLKMELNPGQIVEMCYMILDCCAQQRTYEKFFGLLAQKFCQLNKIYVEPFTDIFKNSYETIFRLETNKLRNVAKFFAHLLYTDAISWLVLANIKLNEVDTSSSSRIFIKILFQDLAEFMGLKKLFERVKDVTLQEAFDGLFPRDNPKNTRFAINFFTSIGLGGLTDELREHLKAIPKKNLIEEEAPIQVEESSSSSSSSTSSSSSSSSSSSESEDDKRKKKKRSSKNDSSKRKPKTTSKKRKR